MPPALTDYTYAMGETGFILNSDFSNTLPFVDVDSITGLDSAPTRLNTTEREGMDGTYVDALFSSMRTVVITGTAYSNIFDADTICDILRAQFSNSTTQPFYFKHPGKPIRFVLGQGGGAQYNVDTLRRVGQTAIQMTVLCADPYIYDYPANFSSAAPQAPLVNGLNFNNQVNFLTGDNTGFESTSGQWTNVLNCAAARTTAQAHSGVASLALTSSAAGTMTAASCLATSIATQGFPCSPNDTITTNGWFRTAVSARTCNIGVQFYDITGTVISALYGGNITDSTSAWTQATGSITAPASTVWGRVSSQVQSTAAANEVHYIDDIFVAVNGLGFNVGFGDVIQPSIVIVTNNGTRPAYPVIQLFGPLTNPTITDSISNISIRLNMTLLSTDNVIIDCRNKAITLNGSSSVRSKYAGLQFFSVPSTVSDTFSLHTDVIGGAYSVTLYNTYY